jgi:hypothetical protein
LSIPSRVIYATAAEIVEDRRSGSLRHLYRALLRALGRQSETMASVQASGPSLAYDPDSHREICAAPWAFPHIGNALGQLPEVRLIDYSDSMKVLGRVLECLGVAD